MSSMLNSGKRILKIINDSGYEAYFVGGYVRDQILGLPSTDIDITTNAHPDDVEKLFEKTIPTGKKYGTVTVIMDDQPFEVTTYRIDQDYHNHRQPETIHYSNQLRDDLIRRDFTMNALVQDVSGNIIDLFEGKKDILNHTIRAIDDPKRRFKEDALRILRAIRFVGKLHFKIDNETLVAMKQDAHLLNKIPTERILKELELILKQPHIHAVYQLFEKLQFGKVFKQLEQAFNLLKGAHKHISLEDLFVLGLYPNDQIDLDRWRLSNKQIWTIHEILSLMDFLEHQRLNPLVAYQHPEELMIHADRLLSTFYTYESQKSIIQDIYKQLTIHSIQDLSINGQMIHPLVKNKKYVGRIIDTLVEAVLYERIKNDQKDLLEYAKNMAEALNETE